MDVGGRREGLGEECQSSAGIREWKALKDPNAERAQNRNVLITECKAGSLEMRMFNWISLGVTHCL